jgi:hypothetical protein
METRRLKLTVANDEARCKIKQLYLVLPSQQVLEGFYFASYLHTFDGHIWLLKPRGRNRWVRITG